MVRKRYSRQQLRKLICKRCYFCHEADYALLDVHRIVPGPEGGKYNKENTLVTCCKCHRKIHSGQIVVDRKYPTSRPAMMVHYFVEGREVWRFEDEWPNLEP